MIRNEQKKTLLENLAKLPIVQVACQKSGISRASYYRLRNSSKKFAEEADKAIQEGIEIINDLSEHQLIAAIKEQNFSAIRFWLQNRHKAYANKLEVTEREKSDNRELTIGQKRIVEEALRLASAGNQENDSPKNDNGESEHNK